MVPETRYAKSGNLHIAFQVVGEGPFDLVFVPGFISNLDLIWEGGPMGMLFAATCPERTRALVLAQRVKGLSEETRLFALERPRAPRGLRTVPV